MARFKNYLLVVLGFAFAGTIGAALGTRTAQAVVSTLVSVVNPTTSPVPTSSVNVTDPGRIAYQSQVSLSLCGTERLSCELLFPAVPTGHRLVVQHISATDQFTNPGATFLRAGVLLAANINAVPVKIEAFSPPFSASTVQGGSNSSSSCCAEPSMANLSPTPD